MTTVAELSAELVRLSRLLDANQEDLVRLSREWAIAERDYRKAKVIAFRALRDNHLTVGERGAEVDASVADERKLRDESDVLRQAALESVRNIRAQLSAVQSIASAVKEEMRLAGSMG